MKQLMIIACFLVAGRLQGQERQPEKITLIVCCGSNCVLENTGRESAFREGGRDKYELSASEIKMLPYTEINDMIATMPGVYQRRRGAELSIAGSQEGDITYIIDGMHIMRR